MTVRAKADAVRAYSKAAKDRSLEIEAVAIRTVAERRLGQILAAERDAGRLAEVRGREKGQATRGEGLILHRRDVEAIGACRQAGRTGR